MCPCPLQCKIVKGVEESLRSTSLGYLCLSCPCSNLQICQWWIPDTIQVILDYKHVHFVQCRQLTSLSPCEKNQLVSICMLICEFLTYNSLNFPLYQ